MNSIAADAVADATRRALDELDSLPDGSQLGGVVIILDIQVPDPDDPDASWTHTLWKTSTISSSWAYGICATAAAAILQANTR